jgi:hypothetical protein
VFSLVFRFAPFSMAFSLHRVSLERDVRTESELAVAPHQTVS